LLRKCRRFRRENLRVNLGKEGVNRHGSRFVHLETPMFVVTPGLYSSTGSVFYESESHVLHATGPAHFVEAMQFVDEQLLACSEILGVSPEKYKPIISGGAMRIKMSVDRPPVPPGFVRSMIIRADGVWFFKGKWGLTWRES
jgi:hypothetical protein